MKSTTKIIILALGFLCSFAVAGEKKSAESDNWIQLFNGKDLNDWTVKFTNSELGVNYKDTFRVEDGVLKVSYENYETFNNKFGHIFYNTPYSNYRLRLQYRFTGEQAAEAPEWAYRNSGIMIHSPAPSAMRFDQAFPVCVEVQLLGGNGKDERPTGNICSPSSHVTLNGKIDKTHCINSTSKTYHGDQWVTAEIEVRGNTSIKHFINGELVFDYGGPILDDEDPDAKKLLDAGADKAMSGGYISLQAESHPVEFRKIELLPLPNS